MRVTCVIDNLAPGGAQRQLCMLATLLKGHGVDMRVLTYYPHDFFAPTLRSAGVELQCIEERTPLKRILAFRDVLRRGDQDVVLAFLETPTVLAELAALPRRDWGLVVSERSSYAGGSLIRLRRNALLHRVADHVTTNSHTNRLLIEKHAFWLRGRVSTIYNAVDLNAFAPRPHVHPDSKTVRFLGIGRFSPEKNISGLIEAVTLAARLRPDLDITLDWHGDGGPARDQASLMIKRLGQEDRICVHPPCREVADLYARASAVIVPSYFEGLPNVVCEAMACGKPVIVSDVCDNRGLVADGRNGLLFDPTSIEDIAGTMIRFAGLLEGGRVAMGDESRRMAEGLFSPDVFAESYLRILTAAANREHVEARHWPPDVPRSAHRPAWRM